MAGRGNEGRKRGEEKVERGIRQTQVEQSESVLSLFGEEGRSEEQSGRGRVRTQVAEAVARVRAGEGDGGGDGRDGGGGRFSPAPGLDSGVDGLRHGDAPERAGGPEGRGFRFRAAVRPRVGEGGQAAGNPIAGRVGERRPVLSGGAEKGGGEPDGSVFRDGQRKADERVSDILFDTQGVVVGREFVEAESARAAAHFRHSSSGQRGAFGGNQGVAGAFEFGGDANLHA